MEYMFLSDVFDIKMIENNQHNNVEKEASIEKGTKLLKNKLNLEQKLNDMDEFEAKQEETGSVLTPSPLKSSHIFMFPFQWEYHSIQNQEQVNMKKFHSLLKKNGKWEYEKWDFESELDYNEYMYFYENVRQGIYSFEEEEKVEDAIVANYTYKEQKGKYCIHVRQEDDKCKAYELDLDKITLKVYETGVGILAFHLENYLYPDKSDILIINEFGRRLYPQYLSDQEGERTKGPKGNMLADKIEIYFKGKKVSKQSFEQYDSLHTAKEHINEIPKLIRQLLGENFIPPHQLKGKRYKITVTPVIDDRMFVIGWYGNDDLITYLGDREDRIIRNNRLLKKQHRTRRYSEVKKYYLNNFDEENKEYSYLGISPESEFWSKYLFVDGKDNTCQSENMQKKLLKEHTYERWINYGSLYGATRYSFMLLTSDYVTLGPSTFLIQHMKTMYYQMVCLVLAQRATILRFSNEVSKISRLAKEDLSQSVSDLYGDYIQFVNRLYFREITAQEQGIELYNLLVQVCNIERDVKDLDREIDELHQYSMLIEEKKKRKEEEKTNRLLNILTLIGAAFVVPSFITGLLGMNIFPKMMAVLDPSIKEATMQEKSLLAEQSSFSLKSILEFFKAQEIQTWFTVFFLIPLSAFIILMIIDKVLSILFDRVFKMLCPKVNYKIFKNIIMGISIFAILIFTALLGKDVLNTGL